MSQIVGIAKRKKKRAVMEVLDEGMISVEKGLEGDFRGKPGRRQLTVLSESAWKQACKELYVNLPWTVRRANLLVDDIDLENSAGKCLVIGDIELLITQETDPCERMEEASPGLFEALAKGWRGGVCCKVLKSGKVELGDKVVIREKHE